MSSLSYQAGIIFFDIIRTRNMYWRESSIQDGQVSSSA